MYHTILVPLDCSPRAEAIRPHGEDLARRYQARVVRLHVDTDPSLLRERDEVVDVNDYMEKRQGAHFLRQHLRRRAAANRPSPASGSLPVYSLTS